MPVTGKELWAYSRVCAQKACGSIKYDRLAVDNHAQGHTQPNVWLPPDQSLVEITKGAVQYQVLFLLFSLSAQRIRFKWKGEMVDVP